VPKRQSLWKRETKCLVCETKVFNFQAMAKSQKTEYDEWLVPHSSGIGEYDDYLPTLKTTVCPKCLMASNEYSFGVDNYKYFTRNMRKNSKLVEMYQETIEGRFQVMAREFERLEEECAVYDKEKGKPPNMRCRATLEKIWSQREQYAEPFFTLLFSEPRDYATALVAFAMDRHCHLLRLGYENDIEYDSSNPDDVHDKVKAFFEENTLDMKSADTRLYYVASNYLQCEQFLDHLAENVCPESKEKYAERKQQYHKEAFDFLRYSEANEDMSAIPQEFKEGGMGYLLCKLYLEVGDKETAQKHLAMAKRYANNTLKRISTTSQQNFVNWVDDIDKMMNPPEEEETEEAPEENSKDKKKKKKK